MWEDSKIPETGEQEQRKRAEMKARELKNRVDVCVRSRFEGVGGSGRESERETDRRDGVSDRPSLCWVLKPGALRQLWYGWRTTLALLCNAVGREGLCDCIHIVKNKQHDRLCKQASFTQCCLCCVLLIGDIFLHKENKARKAVTCEVVFFPAGDKVESKNKLQWKWQFLYSMWVIK